MNAQKLKRDDLIYADLCYQVMGILFSVWSELGIGHRENIYQKAVAQGLKAVGISFSEQAPATVEYLGEPVGKYYFDFLIENKLILELKVREYFSKQDIAQLYAYLRSKNLKLGLIAHFTRTGVKSKRVVNIT